ncbi:MAG: ATP-binding cassette domain-containing protein, partial [Balneolales bacterium]
MSGNPVIEFSGVTVRFDEKPVLHNLNFQLQNGEFVYLIGQTGAGKSSF